MFTDHHFYFDLNSNKVGCFFHSHHLCWTRRCFLFLHNKIVYFFFIYCRIRTKHTNDSNIIHTFRMKINTTSYVRPDFTNIFRPVEFIYHHILWIKVSYIYFFIVMWISFPNSICPFTRNIRIKEIVYGIQF